MALENLHLEHVPPTYQVYTALFRDVANTEFLHKQLLSRNTDFQYAFIDASSVISRLHLLSAVYSAVNALLDGTLRTPNVHSEMVVSFNINNNVGSRPLLGLPGDRGQSPFPAISQPILTLPRSQMLTGDGA
jgi:EKC/KEOPS complex subunit CGI121/TPRKB